MNLQQVALNGSLSTNVQEWSGTGIQLFSTGNTYSSQLLLVPLFVFPSRLLCTSLVICAAFCVPTCQLHESLQVVSSGKLEIERKHGCYYGRRKKRAGMSSLWISSLECKYSLNFVFHSLLQKRRLGWAESGASLQCVGRTGTWSWCIVNVLRVTWRTSYEYMNKAAWNKISPPTKHLLLLDLHFPQQSLFVWTL